MLLMAVFCSAQVADSAAEVELDNNVTIQGLFRKAHEAWAEASAPYLFRMGETADTLSGSSLRGNCRCFVGR